MSDKQADVETIKQWGIKAISSRVSDEISEAAPKLGLTNGQLIEKMWEAWKAGGQPMALPAQSRPDPAIADLAALLTAVGTLPEHISLPGEVRTLINDRARQARGHAAKSRERPEQLKIAAE
jgi:hypothetical protein